MKKYKAALGARFKDQDAQIIGSFLEDHFPDGQFNAEDLVALARPKNSPVHEYFQWNDKLAAEKYRLDQARYLIRHIVVVTPAGTMREFHNVRLSKDETSYVQKDRAKELGLWAQVLESAFEEVKYWNERYKTYKEFQGISRAVRTIERKKPWLKNKSKQSKSHRSNSGKQKSL